MCSTYAIQMQLPFKALVEAVNYTWRGCCLLFCFVLFFPHVMLRIKETFRGHDRAVLSAVSWAGFPSAQQTQSQHAG